MMQYGSFKNPENTRQIIYFIVFDNLKISTIQLFKVQSLYFAV